MKVKYVCIMALSAALLGSCTTEDVPAPEKPDIEDNTGEGGVEEPEVTNPLTVKAGIAALQQARANVITAWQYGHNMGLYTEGNNLSYIYNGNEWVAKTPYQVDKEQTVFAYYPYTENIAENHTTRVDVKEQNDVLYGSTTVSPDFPQAQLEMKHSMSLVRVKVMRDEYRGKGHVESVIFSGVPEYAELDIRHGDVYLYGNEPEISVKAGGSFMLNDESPVLSELIVPHSPAGRYSVTFNVDGKDLTYHFPDRHFWESGMMYTYTIKIKGEYNSEINVDDVPIDVDYWGQFGKTDEIVWKYPENNGIPEWDDDEDIFTISSNYTKYGYDTYQNEGRPFGLFYYFLGNTTFDGKIRFVFMQGDRIVEKFQPVAFSVDNWGGKAIQCYVTSNPGTYQLVPLFQRKGESTWFKAYDYNNGSSAEWMYEVLPPAQDDLPSLRQLYLESEGQNIAGLGYDVPYNKEFGVVYTLSNKGRKPLKGKIKATWEREFKLKSNSYFPDTKKHNTTNDNEWNDEIGTMDVNIPSGVRFWKGLIDCKVTKWYENPMSSNNVTYAEPVLHLYWQQEGSSEWTLLRLDADYLFNRDYEGTEFSIWNETRNYIGIGLEEWDK